MSINGEPETLAEELRSTAEELQSSNSELWQANDDLSNLLTSISSRSSWSGAICASAATHPRPGAS